MEAEFEYEDIRVFWMKRTWFALSLLSEAEYADLRNRTLILTREREIEIRSWIAGYTFAKQ